MTADLSTAQRRVLRNLAGWSIADALLDPERGCAHLRSSMWGGSYAHDEITGWFQCESRAITVKPQLGREVPALVTLTYTAIARYSAALPAGVRQTLTEARDQNQAVHVEWLDKKFPDNADEWPAHLHRTRHAQQRLRDAILAALPLDTPIQLDLFGIPT